MGRGQGGGSGGLFLGQAEKRDFQGRTENIGACSPLTGGHTWRRVSWGRKERRRTESA